MFDFKPNHLNLFNEQSYKLMNLSESSVTFSSKLKLNILWK